MEFSEIVPINGTLYNGNIGKNNHFILNFFEIVPFKGGYIAQSKMLKIHFMVLSNRVGQDNFVGTGMTVKLGLVCLPDTEQKSKIRFSQIAYSGHVTCFDEKFFVQGNAKKSGLQCAIIKLGLSGRHRGKIRQFLTINRFFGY